MATSVLAIAAATSKYWVPAIGVGLGWIGAKLHSKVTTPKLTTAKDWEKAQFKANLKKP